MIFTQANMHLKRYTSFEHVNRLADEPKQPLQRKNGLSSQLCAADNFGRMTHVDSQAGPSLLICARNMSEHGFQDATKAPISTVPCRSVNPKVDSFNPPNSFGRKTSREIEAPSG